MRTCDQVNEFLSTFKPYTPKHKTRVAYEVKESDQIIDCDDERFGVLKTDKGSVKFIRNIEFLAYQVFPGDFIEMIRWPDVAIHWPRAKFEAQNVTANDTVIQRGDAVLEETYPGALNVAGHVIKIKDRYFIGIENGRVHTAWCLAGATKFCRHNDGKKLQKTLAELAARKKKTQVLEVGYWSREFAEVQGGAV
ncbi:MAG TPA: hypothetical protein DF774_10570 [Rheinheimera sp.]|uniref:hypothetical protein n=1 Tax=Rheinheimera sp. TaxID=1869214 RepID=UPI000EC373F2|nr:hypothetical protein [Rheinheimera sp.]HCU66191.1 hypothetical protein [Rheinheimera sp.]